MLQLLITFIWFTFSRIAINHPNEFFNVEDNSVDVEPGTEVLIRVQPTELVTDEAVIDVPVERRNCRLASEVPEDMTLFKSYSRSSCNFNCMFEYR